MGGARPGIPDPRESRCEAARAFAGNERQSRGSFLDPFHPGRDSATLATLRRARHITCFQPRAPAQRLSTVIQSLKPLLTPDCQLLLHHFGTSGTAKSHIFGSFAFICPDISWSKLTYPADSCRKYLAKTALSKGFRLQSPARAGQFSCAYVSINNYSFEGRSQGTQTHWHPAYRQAVRADCGNGVNQRRKPECRL